jgi:hypothetical protein
MSAKILLASLVMCGALIGFTGDTVSACTCVGWVPLEVEVENAQAIFTATVLDTQRTGLGREWYWQMTVQPDRYWKGFVTSPMEIYTAENDALCGRLVMPGEEYLFFVYGNPGSYSLNSCSWWTGPVEIRESAIVRLGPPTPVQVSASTWGKIKSFYR